MTMTCEEHDNTYNLGQFHALIHSLLGPVGVAASVARRTYAAAMRIDITQSDANMMIRSACDLEEAAKALREAAASAKPALRLVAAE